MKWALLLLIGRGVGLEAKVSGRVVNALTGEGVGMDFAMSNARVFRVEGHFTGRIPGGQLYATLARSGGTVDRQGFPLPQTGVHPESGRFQFRGVRPGNYILQVASNASAGLVGQAAVSVGAEGVKDLEVPQFEGQQVWGKVKVESDGELDAVLQKGLELDLFVEVTQNSSMSTRIKLGQDGSFRFARGIAGRKTVRILNTPVPVYVKKFQLNGKDQVEPVFEDGGEIELVLSTGVGNIVGTAE